MKSSHTISRYGPKAKKQAQISPLFPEHTLKFLYAVFKII